MCFLKKKGCRQHLPKFALFLIGCLFISGGVWGNLKSKKSTRWRVEKWEEGTKLRPVRQTGSVTGTALEPDLCPFLPFPPALFATKCPMSPSACNLCTLFWTNFAATALFPQLFLHRSSPWLIKPYLRASRFKVRNTCCQTNCPTGMSPKVPVLL